MSQFFKPKFIQNQIHLQIRDLKPINLYMFVNTQGVEKVFDINPKSTDTKIHTKMIDLTHVNIMDALNLSKERMH